jgi:hypothetical protein
MPFWRRGAKTKPADEQAVITHLPLSNDGFGSAEEREAVFALEDRLTEAATRLGGEHDGNEFGAGEAILYTYGPDADALLGAVRESLTGSGFPVRQGAFAIKRYGRAGDPDARQERVSLA